MRLALFDLDHTLLPIDSADTWSHFLVARAGFDAADYGSRIREFARTYKAGCFDVDAYLAFQMGMLAQFPRARLEAWRAEFLAQPYAIHSGTKLIGRRLRKCRLVASGEYPA